MSQGTWDPDAEQASINFQLDNTLLARLISYSQQDQLNQLKELLSTSELQIYAQLMKTSKDQWLIATQTLSDDEIIHLMRFFTVSEKLPGWEAGANSPVIWLGKILKQRGTGINRELVLWIKAHSDNQFLPHGPL